MDYRPRRLRTGLLLGSALLAGVALGPAFGLVARRLVPVLGMSGAFAQDSGDVNTYRLLGLFGDVFERVRDEYVICLRQRPDRKCNRGYVDRPRSALRLHNAVAFQEMQCRPLASSAALVLK